MQPRSQNHEMAKRGISAHFDRRNKFHIKRFRNSLGLEIYVLENKGLSERIYVERSHFDRFRRTLRQIWTDPSESIDLKLSYRGKDYFQFKSSGEDHSQLTIIEFHPGPKSTDSLNLKLKALEVLVPLLYADTLDHPADSLDLITRYHRLFQFTFQDGSESITSDLTLRKDVLSQVDRYRPKPSASAEVLLKKGGEGAPRAKREGSNKGFKPRLGERDSSKKIKVNYEALFDPNAGDPSVKIPKAADSYPDSPLGASSTAFPLPILSSDIKLFQKEFFTCQFNQIEIQEFRDLFLKDRSSEFYLGFEILDAIFRKASGLRTFRFPLYYMKVNIEESGRELYIYPEGHGRIFLNHIALANLVESFAPTSTGDPVGQFFETLQAQTLKITGRDDRVRLNRLLPIDETVFDRTREMLLGYAGENGKGGLLSHLKVVGIEADLGAVFLYKAAKNDAPMIAALNSDLDNIQKVAHDSPQRFYGSMLGRFLVPEAYPKKRTEPFSRTLAMPGAQPQAMRNLVGKLNQSDLVLLEGPPGTGKTFSIMNLFIHSLNTGKRLLVVSDQEAAIHALTEKLQEYLLGKNQTHGSSSYLLPLWNNAIKVVDKIPEPGAKLSTWSRQLKDMLHILDPLQSEWPVTDPKYMEELDQIDRRVAQFKDHIQKHMEARLGPDADVKKKVAPKRLHATSIHDINDLVAFLNFVSDEIRVDRSLFILSRYIKDREYILHRGLKQIYGYFDIPDDLNQTVTELDNLKEALQLLLKRKPRSYEKFRQVLPSIGQNAVLRLISERFQESFTPQASFFQRVVQYIGSWFKHRPLKLTKICHQLLQHQLDLLQLVKDQQRPVLNQLKTIHRSLGMPSNEPIPLCLEICRFAIESKLAGYSGQVGIPNNPTVQESLQEIERLQEKRDGIVAKAFVGRLGEIARGAYEATQDGSTTLSTTISALLDNLKTFQSVEAAKDTLVDLREKLIEAFPIWICRKQAVPFLFPCSEKIFDLVVVDEATQCRVDDALPLLFRAQKVMVVGDEKQTVLAKDSVIDDFLFREFDLGEHLRGSQALGMKGGGSHIFGLVKGIKQASVMLDEHYRCPPSIIQFSNRYVYGNELKAMQWQSINDTPAVIVDHSEREATSSVRRDSGKYKGLETDMIDRFFEFMKHHILAIEKQTGKTINTERDVAICYFLLKNEPYIKDVKAEFLQKLGRGAEILDGAGAALQGKERDYIFYLWDINRGNMGAFRQGDDPDKRKGELNVLMSRPKKRAYHYLHKNFHQLDHKSASITDFLWTELNRSEQKGGRKLTPRTQKPSEAFVPWRRSSGELMEAVLASVLGQMDGSLSLKEGFQSQKSIVVGDPRHKVDLVLSPKKINSPDVQNIGLVDLADFGGHQGCAQDVMDYYFQCIRAKPNIRPYFVFIHELATARARSFKLIERALNDLVAVKKVG